VAYYLPLALTVVLNTVGSQLTGPSLNPAITFSWWHHFGGHQPGEHVLVYWAAPFVGAILGGEGAGGCLRARNGGDAAAVTCDCSTRAAGLLCCRCHMLCLTIRHLTCFA
jgi:hypothetical protein